MSGCEWRINISKWVGSPEQALGSIEPYKNSDINFRPGHQEWLVIFLRHRELRRLKFCIFISCSVKIKFINYLAGLRELFRPSTLTGIISTRSMIKFAFREGQFFVAGGEFIASESVPAKWTHKLCRDSAWHPGNARRFLHFNTSLYRVLELVNLWSKQCCDGPPLSSNWHKISISHFQRKPLPQRNVKRENTRGKQIVRLISFDLRCDKMLRWIKIKKY